MKTRRHVLATGLASLLVLAMSPMPAPIYMNIPAGEMLKLRVDLPPAACEGGGTLEKGPYDLELRSMGDGSVRAMFRRASVNGDGKTCQATGKVQGHEVVPGALNAVGAPNAKPNAANTPPTFATLGFTPQIRPTTLAQGHHLNVIVKGQGSNQILIGLLLPAVQKVREAAAAPAH